MPRWNIARLQQESERAHFMLQPSRRVLAKDSRWTVAFHRHRERASLAIKCRRCLTPRAPKRFSTDLYLGHGEQLIDHHTVVDHAQPRCESHEFYHGILAGRSHGVFNGKIFVRQDAQKTNAKQEPTGICCCLNNAQIDTKPQLEIYADDVKCTHGRRPSAS